MNGLFAYPADVDFSGSARAYLLFQVIYDKNGEPNSVKWPNDDHSFMIPSTWQPTNYLR